MLGNLRAGKPLGGGEHDREPCLHATDEWPRRVKISDFIMAEHSQRLLITAGPTYEPIDAVRFLGNRSSGRLGIELARAASRAGWDVTLLLGPTSLDCTDSSVRVERFQSTADLESLLDEHFPSCDVLVMAAAVADYRPVLDAEPSSTKIRRKPGGLDLVFESTPDLLAKCSAQRRSGQRIVGFALEPRERMMESARAKLERKGVDAIVANPLETMDAPTIEATLITRDSGEHRTDGPIAKSAFAGWLLERIGALSVAPGRA